MHTRHNPNVLPQIPDLQAPHQEKMDYFRIFMEDYNTATMPHEKFYDIGRWETEYQRACIQTNRPAHHPLCK
jgi:hypothetical protein